jgi:monoamine oxidase
MSTVVIGAGLAGLAAARRLHEQGEEVLVLEARDCIGGRTRSLRDVLLHDQPADLGASFIDLGQDLLLQTCDQFGLGITPRLALFPKEPDGTFSVASLLRNRLILQGELIEAPESTALADEVRTAVDAVPPVPAETLPAWAARAGISERARAAVLAQAGFDPTSPPWRVQMLLAHPPLIGKVCWMLTDGTDSVAHAISDELDIRLEQPVRLIARNGGGITVETDRESFSADGVVVATPVTPTLSIGFDPVLPDWKVSALLSTPMSQGGKVIAQYSQGSRVIEALGHAVLTDGPISIVWARPLGPDDTVVVLGLMPDRADGVLRSQERALTALDDIVRAVAGDAPTRLAGVMRDWTAEEFTGGVVSVPWADHGRLTSLLAQRVGPIHFAGEHTDDIFTTGMEGALRSGLRAADEVRQRHGHAMAPEAIWQ